eukprot:m51a1_g2966 hypothetical protein (476) ;mRNA; f:692703-694418
MLRTRPADSAKPAAAASAAREAAATDDGPHTFSELGLADWLVRACREMGIRRPTEVQKKCVVPLLAGRDVLGGAETGSGKTAAFALPILHNLSKDPFGVFALIADQFRALGAPMKVRVLVATGGSDIVEQSAQLSRRPHVVIATPGRLAEILGRDGANAVFGGLRYVVYDEADRLLDPSGSYAPDLERINGALPARHTTALFSATLVPLTRDGAPQLPTKPDAFVWSDVMSLPACNSGNCGGADGGSGAAISALAARTVETCKQEYLFLPSRVRECYLVYLVRKFSGTSTIVFARTCRRAELARQLLIALGLKAVSLHSYLSQKERSSALDAFRSARADVLVATDLASRGLDIPQVGLVVNYDMPRGPEDYVHRIGRTARAGRRGRAITLVTERDVGGVHEIEGATGVKLELHPADDDDVFFHLTESSTAREIAEMFLEETKFGEKKEAYKQSAKRQQEEEHCSGTPAKRGRKAV